MSDGSNIAKNTFYLYSRMICITVVSLYTSRVILGILGASDYGVYQTVGGIVGILAFINNALATGSSRFLTFELGRGDSSRIKAMFSTLFATHVLLGVLIIVIGEPIGIWYINNKLNIPDSRLFEAQVVYQFSLITTFMNITQVPFSAIIIAHENMKIYAYVSLLEVILKLIIVFSLGFAPVDKLIAYAAMLCGAQLLILTIYRSYCRRKYSESRVEYKLFDGKMLKEVFEFSSWSLFASVSCALIQNGTVILLTNFFSPVLAASRAVADQVSNAVNQFITNFRTASNPQIVKRYAVEDYEGSKNLLLKSTYMSYYLMLFLALPVILLAEPLVRLWLGQIPEYTVLFIQWAMIQNLFAVFDISFYVPLYAKARLKENALLAPTIDLLCLGCVYISFVKGSSPVAICYIYTIMTFLQGIIEKPILICLLLDYKLKDIWKVYYKCILVSLIAVPIPCCIAYKIDVNHLVNFILVCVVSCVSVIVSVWFIGIENADRHRIVSIVTSKINKKNKE